MNLIICKINVNIEPIKFNLRMIVIGHNEKKVLSLVLYYNLGLSGSIHQEDCEIYEFDGSSEAVNSNEQNPILLLEISIVQVEHGTE